MVNPISAAYNMLLGFLSVLPQPILAFLYLILGLFVIVCIVRIIMQH